MERAIAKAVKGRRVLADGRWLTCIGNKNVKAGDVIWTDGRCVYGNQSEGGGCCLPIDLPLSGIPILGKKGKHQYFAKDMLQDAGDGEEHSRMLNNGRKYQFFDLDQLLDAEFDDKGNLYTLESGGATYNFDRMEYESFGDLCLARNGEAIMEFDILPCLKRQCEKASKEAETLVSPMAGDNPGSSTAIEFTQCLIMNGKVDVYGNYALVLDTIVDAAHEEWAYQTMPGPWGSTGTTYIMQNIGRSSCQQRSLITREEEQVYMEGIWTDTTLYEGDGSHEETQWDLPAGALRLPLQDGYYCTFDGKVDMHYPSSGGDYTASIYNAEKELVVVGPFNPFMNLSICKLGDGEYLIGTGFYLYLYRNGTLMKEMNYCNNLRLRKMTNLNRWKKERG